MAQADESKSVLVSADGGYVFSGYSWSNASFDKSEDVRGNYDYWIVKTDAEGNRNHHATDPDGDTLAWSISGGADASKFTINAATGELIMNSSDFENPTDADGNNTYEISLSVTDSGGLSASQSVLVYIQDKNEAPFGLSLSNITIMENQPIGTEVGQLSASDQDGDTLSYALINGAGATHNQNFSLDENGVLKTNRTFDFENDSINQSIRVSVTDPLNASAESIFSITLSDLNEAPYVIFANPDKIDSKGKYHQGVPEGQKFVTDLNASDPEGDAVTFSIYSGLDANFFEIDAHTGIVEFKTLL